MFPIKTILHPTDFSETSEHAFRLACSLARERGARLVVLHVVPTSLSAEQRGFGEDIEEELSRVSMPDANVDVERRLEEGDPTRVILRVARELNSDLIVLGSHGRTGFGRLLMGSVAEQLLREACCPVLTVKTPLQATETADQRRQRGGRRAAEALRS
jgi:nucleotide-binding universal stress UspA family protein